MRDPLIGELTEPLMEDTPLFAAAQAHLRRPIKSLYRGSKEPVTAAGCRVIDHESAVRTRSKRYRSGSRRTRRIARTRRGH